MRKPEIIATIGVLYNYDDCSLYEELLHEGICQIRYNLGKFWDNPTELKLRLDQIQKIYERYGKEMRIMLDLPYPGKKQRLHLRDEKMYVKKDELVVISSCKDRASYNGYKFIYVKTDRIGTKKINENKVIYSDGECSFDVISQIDEDTLLVRACMDGVIYSKKAITIGSFEKAAYMEEEKIDLISRVEADSIALSFVSDDCEVDTARQFFPGKEIISKIECQEGIDNVDRISKKSNIMLGRGDLCIYSNYHDLYHNQIEVADACRRNGCKLYFATGILTSLIHHSRPAQADIIDVTNTLLLEPHYMVLNYGVVEENCALAVDTINRIYERIR